MPCFHPVESWYSKEKWPSGKNKILFGYYDPKKALNNSPTKPDFMLPCRQCVGCRLAKSAEWATRVINEADLYEDNSFITLTYAPEHVPADMSLDHSHYQKFMKRLRKKYVPKCPYPVGHDLRDEWMLAHAIRFYMCGEYGDNFGRPHFHAILFNHDFKDKYLWKVQNGQRLYRSEELESLWPYGYSTIGNVTFESAAYVARYIMKKQTGDAAETHYTVFDEDTGEVLKNPITGEDWVRTPEYNQPSRNGGIGKRWFEQFKDDVFPNDYIVTPDGRKLKPPKFYDTIYEADFPHEMEEIKFNRVEKAEKHIDNNTPERLKVREQVAEAKVKQLPRTLK